MSFVEKRREQAADFVMQIADVHKFDFVRKIAELARIQPFSFKEPYLNNILAMFVRQYMESLDNAELFYFGEQKAMSLGEKLQSVDDDLERRMNSKLDEFRQQAIGITKYRWSTQGDDKVRGSHAARNGQIFSWDNPPAGGHPGSDFGCRCVAIPVIEEGFAVMDSSDVVVDSDLNNTDRYKPSEAYIIGFDIWGQQTAEDLKEHSKLIEKVAKENNIDPNLIRAVITNERITRLGGGSIEADVSAIQEIIGGLGTYGPAQLGPQARFYSGLSVEQAMTYEGAIVGAGNWLGAQRLILIIKEEISNPTNAQIATRYNSGNANSGKVTEYGSRVEYLIDKLYSKH